MSGVEIRQVGEDEAELRLDRWFRLHYPGLGHGRLEKLLRTGQVRLDGKRAKASSRVSPGQEVRVPPLGEAGEGSKPKPQAKAPSAAEAERLRASVLYRDDWLIAIDKPAGLAVQGGSGQQKHLDAMLEALRFDAEEPPRLVHRLDKDTSGVLLLARNRTAARILSESFRSSESRKLYWALVTGQPRPVSGIVDLALEKAGTPGREKVRGGQPEGQRALTLYATVARQEKGRRFGPAWLLLRPVTGRTHQLRVHCAALGCPILGDGKYGGREAFPPIFHEGGSLRRLQLHAREIAIPHPSDGTTLRISAPLPADMREAFAALGFDPEANLDGPERALERLGDGSGGS